MLAEPAVRRFHQLAARGLQARGLLQLHALTLEGRVVGVLHALRAQATAYYYLSGFAPELGRLNLGTLLVARLMESAITEGCTRCDLLRGAEAYKLAWGGKPRPLWRLRLLGA